MEEGDKTESCDREEPEKRLVQLLRKADAVDFMTEDRPQDEFDGGDDDARGDPSGDHGK